MAHFAKLNLYNQVIHVSKVDNHNCLDENGNESEEVGIAYLKSIHGQDTIWKQTSYNTSHGVHNLNGTPLRKNYAGIDGVYDPQKDAFIPPKHYASWILNEQTCQWEAPIAEPDDGKFHIWNEETTSWITVE